MDVTTTTLDSGVIVTSESMSTVRSVALGAWMTVGSRDEADDEHGCSHFLEHLLFKGTERRTARDIAEPMDAVGGELNAFTTREMTVFHARVIDEDLPLAIDLLGDMLNRPTNTPADVDAERDVVLSEIDIFLDTPEDLVGTALVEQVVGDHQLAKDPLGTDASVTGMARDTIHEFFQRWYRPANTVIAAAGNVDHDALVALVEQHVGDLGRPGGDRPVRSAPPAPTVSTASVQQKDNEQVHITIGGRAIALDDPRRPALSVLDVILGGGMSSRLFQTIREERGLAYSTYSWTSSWKDLGMWGVYAGVSAKNQDEALALLVSEVDRFSGSVTEEEVARARGTLRGSVVLGYEDSGARMSKLGRWVTSDIRIRTIDELLRMIDGVTLSDVRAIAEELLLGTRHLAVVGPTDSVDVASIAPTVSV
ncbi:MAG: putative Zn-dependent peptidase [Myxococcota bacterium]|jgi:predicted Zn-dependent peptidase